METIKVQILTPQNIIFQGDALSISSTNPMGPFDILPEHANFITLTENADIVIHKTDGQKIKFHFPLSILHTYHNNVTIYTNIQLSQIEA